MIDGARDGLRARARVGIIPADAIIHSTPDSSATQKHHALWESVNWFFSYRVVARQRTARLASNKPPATDVKKSAYVTGLLWEYIRYWMKHLKDQHSKQAR